MFCLFFYFGSRHYTYSGAQFLEPYEHKVVSVKELRNGGIPDEFGRLIPFEISSGQIKLVLHDVDITKVAGQAVISNTQLGVSFALGCSICPPVVSCLYFRKNPNDPPGTIARFEGTPGSKHRIYAIAEMDDGSRKDVSGNNNTTYSLNGAVAKVNKSWFWNTAEVEMIANGQTYITGSLRDCNWIPREDPCDPSSSPDCPCICNGTNWYVPDPSFWCSSYEADVRVGCLDARDQIINEYHVYGVNFIPTCADFNEISCANIGTGEYNQDNDYKIYPWYIMRVRLCDGFNQTRTNHGNVPLQINSGYRNPASQARINPSAPQSRHQFGDAVDVQVIDRNGDGSRTDDWERLKTAAKDAGACVEPLSVSGEGHVHMDWRGACPAGW